MRKFLDYDGVQALVSKIKDMFVQREDGKSLSTNDYTNKDKQKLADLKKYEVATDLESGLMSTIDKKKLDGISEGAEANIINQIKRNGAIQSPSDGSVNIDVPVRVSQLTNDSGFQTKSQVQTLISSASKMSKKIVATLPSSGEDNVMYLKGPSGSGNNVYEEFLWLNSKWEKIGDTATKVDLSGYVKSSDFTAITTQEINRAFGG